MGLSRAAVPGDGERWASPSPTLAPVRSARMGSRAGAVSALVGVGGVYAAGATSAAIAGALRDGTPRPMAMVVVGSLIRV